MHHVQSKIIDKLTSHKTLRYAQLRPPRTESNLFSYHLNLLKKQGLIEKVDGGYSLAPKGKAYVDKVSHKTLQVRDQPKIITLLDIVNDKGETIVGRRPYQPYIGMIVFPTGKVHLEESVETAAQRELKEKLALQTMPLEHRGICYVTGYEQGTFISEVLCHVFHGRYDGPIPPEAESAWFWATRDELPTPEILPGYDRIKTLLRRKGFFYDEITFDLP